MSPDSEEALYNKYPSMLAGMRLGPQESCLSFGIECSEGWYSIIDDALEALESVGSVEVMQIKEKYGSLRIYLGPALEEHFEIVDAAECLSTSTCEVCGEPGKMNHGPWFSVRCDKCE